LYGQDYDFCVLEPVNFPAATVFCKLLMQIVHAFDSRRLTDFSKQTQKLQVA